MLATETQDAPTQKPNATWSPKKASRHAHGHPPSPNKWGSGSSHPSKWSLHIHSRPPSIQCHRCHTDLLEWKAGRRPAHTSSLMCDVWCRVIITDLSAWEQWPSFFTHIAWEFNLYSSPLALHTTYRWPYGCSHLPTPFQIPVSHTWGLEWSHPPGNSSFSLRFHSNTTSLEVSL